MATIILTTTKHEEVPEYFTSTKTYITYYNRVSEGFFIRFKGGKYAIMTREPISNAHIIDEDIQEISKEQYDAALQEFLKDIQTSL